MSKQSRKDLNTDIKDTLSGSSAIHERQKHMLLVYHQHAITSPFGGESGGRVLRIIRDVLGGQIARGPSSGEEVLVFLVHVLRKERRCCPRYGPWKPFWLGKRKYEEEDIWQKVYKTTTKRYE